jgi:hypothetical protein
MNASDAFEQFIATQSVQIPLFSFFINLVVTAILAYLLSLVYVKFGSSISNRIIFSRNLVLLAVATMVVITIVKSSLALSLGLVGALSIVRFRSAIKEPEELIYLFLAITVGLGMGADQVRIVLIACTTISAIIFIKYYTQNRTEEKTILYLSVSTSKSEANVLTDITKLINKACEATDLKRFETSKCASEIVFHISLIDFAHLEQLNQDLKSFDEEITLTYLDQEGIVV